MVDKELTDLALEMASKGLTTMAQVQEEMYRKQAAEKRTEVAATLGANFPKELEAFSALKKELNEPERILDNIATLAAEGDINNKIKLQQDVSAYLQDILNEKNEGARDFAYHYTKMSRGVDIQSNRDKAYVFLATFVKEMKMACECVVTGYRDPKYKKDKRASGRIRYTKELFEKVQAVLTAMDATGHIHREAIEDAKNAKPTFFPTLIPAALQKTVDEPTSLADIVAPAIIPIVAEQSASTTPEARIVPPPTAVAAEAVVTPPTAVEPAETQLVAFSGQQNPNYAAAAEVQKAAKMRRRIDTKLEQGKLANFILGNTPQPIIRQWNDLCATYGHTGDAPDPKTIKDGLEDAITVLKSVDNKALTLDMSRLELFSDKLDEFTKMLIAMSEKLTQVGDSLPVEDGGKFNAVVDYFGRIQTMVHSSLELGEKVQVSLEVR